MDYGSMPLEHEDRVAVVRLLGEHDLATADELHMLLGEQAAAGLPIVVDLTDVEFVDSSIFRVFLLIDESLQKTSRRLVLQLPEHSHAYKPITVLGLDETLVCTPTREQAIQAARNSADGTA